MNKMGIKLFFSGIGLLLALILGVSSQAATAPAPSLLLQFKEGVHYQRVATSAVQPITSVGKVKVVEFFSYGYLKSLSVDVLKIDGIFVKQIATNPADYAMVKSITEMGHAVNKRVVAEFVDKQEVLEKLIELGVDYVQGHFVGMPHLLSELF